MKDYIAWAPRIVQGKLVNANIKRGIESEGGKAFRFFCNELICGTELEFAREKTETEFNIPLIVEECKPKPFSRQKSTYEVHVG